MEPSESRTTTIRARLLVTLCIPVLIIAVVSGRQYLDARSTASDVHSQVALARSTGDPSRLVDAISNERDFTSLDMIGLGDAVSLPVKSVKQARAETNEQLSQLQNSLAKNTSAVQANLGDTFSEVQNGIINARKMVDSYKGARNLTSATNVADGSYAAYTNAMGSIYRANSRAIQQINQADLRNIATGIANIIQGSDDTSQIVRDVFLAQLSGSGQSAQDRLNTSNLLNDYTTRSDDTLSLTGGTPGVGRIVHDYFNRASATVFVNGATQFLTTGKTDTGALLDAAADDTTPIASDATNVMMAGLSARADEQIASANADQKNAVLTLLASTIAMFLIALFGARSFSRPLAKIAGEAEKIADETLPKAVAGVLATPLGADIAVPVLEPASPSAILEVDEVAVALNSIQNRSLELAVEQAGLRRRFTESFAALGQRVQRIVDTQLETLDALEAAEEDSETLADLFTLDHMATRIRRNAQSLIMLAGSERPVERYVANPWPVGDIARVAMQATDDYTRVNIGFLDEAHVVGWAGADIANVIAEFLDNGIHFTDNNMPVKVDGRLWPDGSYLFTITDNGEGLSADALAHANRRLKGEVAFTEAPSRFLGYFVIGHISHRLGLQTAVRPTEGGGVTAAVLVPPMLLTTDQFVPDRSEGETRADTVEILTASRQLHRLDKSRPERPEVPVPDGFVEDADDKGDEDDAGNSAGNTVGNDPSASGTPKDDDHGSSRNGSSGDDDVDWYGDGQPAQRTFTMRTLRREINDS